MGAIDEEKKSPPVGDGAGTGFGAGGGAGAGDGAGTGFSAAGVGCALGKRVFSGRSTKRARSSATMGVWPPTVDGDS